MKISSKSHYALLTIFDLAAQNTGRPVKIASIARRQNIPQKFLELVLSSLKQGGFVESHRGSEGGYSLARRPESITVGEVLRFVDGSPTRQKSSKASGPFSELWHTVDTSIAGILDSTDFASLLQDWEAKQSPYVHNWEI